MTEWKEMTLWQAGLIAFAIGLVLCLRTCRQERNERCIAAHGIPSGGYYGDNYCLVVENGTMREIDP